MYFIYSLLFTLGFVILLPRFLIDVFRHGKYVAGFKERLGNVSPPDFGKPVIWIHCVSVGETQAARPLVAGLRSRFPSHSIAISTTTRTGQELARQIFDKQVEKIFYFPFDWRFVVRKTVRSIRPFAVILMETELWPAFLRECERKQIPVAIVNGRLSDKSFRRYSLIKNFMSRVLKSIRLALMQTEADAERLSALGMKPDKIHVCGNLKFDVGSHSQANEVVEDFRRRFRVRDDLPLILAASTHAPEERVMLEAFKRILSSHPAARLVIAPRHPERFAEVEGQIKETGLRWSRRTAQASQGDVLSQVILVDTIGELPSLYPLATLVFVGGSIARTGGHNILEPASAGVPMITGPYVHNFRSIMETFVNGDAIVQLPEMTQPKFAGHLAGLMSNLISDKPRRIILGANAQKLFEQNRGATDHVLNHLETMIHSGIREGAKNESAKEPVFL